MALSNQNIPGIREVLQHIIGQGERACRDIRDTYELMEWAANHGLDDEQSYKYIQAVEECQWKMREVCQYFMEMDERLKKLEEIKLLYGPPPFFDP